MQSVLLRPHATAGLGETDTHNPTSLASNPSFFGTHAKTGTYDPPTRAETETTFAPSATTDVVLAVRMRLTSLQQGIVYAIYFYTRGGPCADRHDEADIELVTNFLQPVSRLCGSS